MEREDKIRFNYVKLHYEKSQTDIEQNIKFLQSMVNKKSNNEDIYVSEYLCLMASLKALEEKYLLPQVDFSDISLRWNIRNIKDVDYMILLVMDLRKTKPLYELTTEERQQLNVDDDVWEKYLFIETLIEMDKFGCIKRDVEKLDYIYHHNIGNIIIAGIQSLNSKNITNLYAFLKHYDEEKDGGSITEPEKEEKVEKIQEIYNFINEFNQHILNINSTINNMQSNVIGIKNKIQEIEEKIIEFNISGGNATVSSNEEINELTDKINRLESKIEDIEQKIEDINMSGVLTMPDAEGSEDDSEKFNMINDRIMNIENQLISMKNTIELRLEQTVRNIVQEVMEQYKQQLQTEKIEKQNQSTIQQTQTNTMVEETETPIIVDETEGEETETVSNEQQQGKKTYKKFNFKLFLIIWFVIFVLFIIIAFMLT